MAKSFKTYYKFPLAAGDCGGANDYDGRRVLDFIPKLSEDVTRRIAECINGLGYDKRGQAAFSYNKNIVYAGDSSGRSKLIRIRGFEILIGRRYNLHLSFAYSKQHELGKYIVYRLNGC